MHGIETAGSVLRYRVESESRQQDNIDVTDPSWQDERREVRPDEAGRGTGGVTMDQQALGSGEPQMAAVEGLAPLLPEQLLDAPQRTPEQRLMAAVLEDAMRELARPAGDRCRARARRRAAIEAWVPAGDRA